MVIEPVPKNLSLEPDAVAHGERYAELHGTNVSRLVSDFLGSLPLESPVRELMPAVRRLFGVAAGSDADRESAAGRLEELNHITGRVLEQDLQPSRSGHDVVAKPQARCPKTGYLGSEIVDDQLEAVPAAGVRSPAIGHRPARGARRATEQQTQVAAGDVSECRQHARQETEAEVGRVEGDSGVDVVDHVAHVYSGHRSAVRS
jgi:hypothetical protein